MLNQISTEAFHSAIYVNNYLDFVENLPDEIQQRFISQLHELNIRHKGYLRDVDFFYEQWANCPSSELLDSSNATKRNRAMTRLQQSLIAAQEVGDEKLNIIQQLTELIESKTRQLDQNFVNLDYGKEQQLLGETVVKESRAQSPITYSITTSNMSCNYSSATTNASSTIVNPNINSNGNNDRATKRMRRNRVDINMGTEDYVETISKQETVGKQSTSTQNIVSGQKRNTNANVNQRKKRKKTGRQSNQSRDNREETPPVEETIDPDEPTYCLCDQISFGEMILCDNDLCPIEWFHFSCVQLMTKPKGKWYCPNCRGDRPNVMKPKAQFLKELERYNKEKEEKT